MPRNPRRTQGLHAFFAAYPDEAHRQFFKPGLNRRGFFAGAGLATVSGLLGMTIPYYAHMPRGLVPACTSREVSTPSSSTPNSAGRRVAAHKSSA